MKRNRAEATRLKKEKALQVKRDFLTRELTYSNATLAKYSKKWSKMIKEISCEKMRSEVLSWWHQFEKAIDYKDIQISLHLDRINEENNMYRMALISHNEWIENLIHFFHHEYNWIYSELGKQVNSLISYWVEDYTENRIMAIHNEQYLETMRYQLSSIKKYEENETTTKNFSIKTEQTSKYKTLLGDITFHLSNRLDKLNRATKDFTSDYMKIIKKKNKYGVESTERYELLEKDISANIRSRAKLDKLIINLTDKYKELTAITEGKLNDLRKERESLQEFFFLLREKLFYDKKSDFFKQKILTNTSNENIQKMEMLVEKGSNLLKYMSVCRRYQTGEEKMLPYPGDMVDDTENKSLESELHLFWQRVAATNASRYTLNEERIFLKKQNAKLLKKIHSFCACLQCPSLPEVPLRAGKIPYTEGREMVQKQKIQIGKKKKSEDENSYV